MILINAEIVGNSSIVFYVGGNNEIILYNEAGYIGNSKEVLLKKWCSLFIIKSIHFII